MANFLRYQVKHKDSDNQYLAYEFDDTARASSRCKYSDTYNLYEIEYDGRRSPVVYHDGLNKYYALISRCLWKFDSSGNELLTVVNDGFFHGLYIDGSDNIYGCGFGSRLFSNACKLDLSVMHGGISWDIDLNTSLDDIIVDGSGNIYLVGDPIGGKCVWKYNSSRVLQWDYYTGSSSNGVFADGSGNVYIAGNRATNPDSGVTASVVKLNSSGVWQWDFDTGDHAYDVAADGSGNVYIAGNRVATSKSVWKLNSTGVEQWNYDTGTSARGICIDSGGDILICGLRSVVPKTVWKIDSAKTPIWQYDTLYNAAGIVTDASNNVYISNNNSTITTNDFAYKLDSAGVKQWSSPGTGIANAWVFGYDIGVDSLGNVYVGGRHYYRS